MSKAVRVRNLVMLTSFQSLTSDEQIRAIEAAIEEPPTPFSDVDWHEVDCVRKARERNDFTFTLVGQDRSSPRTICFWILENIETALPAKLLDALSKALAMRALKNRKAAD